LEGGFNMRKLRKTGISTDDLLLLGIGDPEASELREIFNRVSGKKLDKKLKKFLERNGFGHYQDLFTAEEWNWEDFKNVHRKRYLVRLGIPKRQARKMIRIKDAELDAQEVVDWLQAAGFGMYSESFITNGICDLPALTELETQKDLRALGLPKAHARLLLPMIQEWSDALPPQASRKDRGPRFSQMSAMSEDMIADLEEFFSDEDELTVRTDALEMPTHPSGPESLSRDVLAPYVRPTPQGGRAGAESSESERMEEKKGEDTEYDTIDGTTVGGSQDNSGEPTRSKAYHDRTDSEIAAAIEREFNERPPPLPKRAHTPLPLLELPTKSSPPSVKEGEKSEEYSESQLKTEGRAGNETSDEEAARNASASSLHLYRYRADDPQKLRDALNRGTSAHELLRN